MRVQILGGARIFLKLILEFNIATLSIVDEMFIDSKTCVVVWYGECLCMYMSNCICTSSTMFCRNKKKKCLQC